MAVRVGLAGTGDRAAGTYAPALAAGPDVHLAGVWGRRPVATETLAAVHDVPAYADFDEFLEQCEAVVFAVPPAVQPELAAAAARRAKAVLLEKPIAGDLAGAEEMTRVIERSGVISQVALTWRYAAAVRHFLEVEVAALAPVGGHGRLVAPAAATARPHAERGLLRTGGVDLLDLLDAALGRIAGVQAHGNPHGWVGLLLEHQGGRVSEASLYGRPHPVSRAEVEVFGPADSARIDVSASMGQAAVTTMIGEFAEGVQHGAAPALDVRHGLHLQNVIEEAESYLLLNG